MTTMTTFDLRVNDHLMRTARVNQQGWILQATRSSGAARAAWTATVLGPIRQHIGASMIRFGERLRGTPAGHSVDCAAV